MGVNYNLIGTRLRQRRKDLKLTQKELGDKIGISASHISAIELAEKAPSLDVLLLLCSNLNITIDHLISGTVYTDINQDISNKIKICSIENRKRINKIVDIFVEEELAK